MAKSKTIYVCKNCGATASQWKGRCNSCESWNSFEEEIRSKSKDGSFKRTSETLSVIERLDEHVLTETERLITADPELNRVLGGGIVPGSMVLIGGEPGIGKSTLMLQLALSLHNQNILYISGEESLNQIRLRAARLGMTNPDCYLYPETDIDHLNKLIKEISPGLIIIDSIQTMYHDEIDGSAGSITQIRECTSQLTKIAKKNHIPVFLIGHITKEGNISGPKVMEHMVDTVLYFEGDRHYNYRILRSMKNRFGSISEIGIYEMKQSGLEAIENPSELLISQRNEALSGISIAAMIEGIRPLMVEIQALVTPAPYGTPQRTATGFDNKRMSMLLAVLEKRCGLKLSSSDVFLNIAGGIKVSDPSVDLSVVAAIASSYEDKAMNLSYCFAGEVGLSGEIRPVRQPEQRIKEAAKLGFKKIFTAPPNSKSQQLSKSEIEVVFVERVDEMLKKIY